MRLSPIAEMPADIRRHNRYAVLSLLREHGALSKSDLVGLTARTSTTISSILDVLLEEGLVRLTDGEDPPVVEASRGRPSTYYRLSSTRWLAAGIQIASDTVTGVVLTLDGQVLCSERLSVPPNLPTQDVLKAAATVITSTLEQTVQNQPEQYGRANLLGIGVALEGIVDVPNGSSISMPYRTAWRDVLIKSYFEEQFGVPVVVDWRVYAATLAEACYGSARGLSDFAYLNVDTGVAVSTVIAGMLVRSSEQPSGSTGELSHAISVGGSRLCYCGNTGCLDTEITTHMLVTQLREMLTVGQWHGVGQFWQTHEPSLDNMILALQQNDALTLQLRNRFSQNLSIAVNSTILLFNANMIVVGGGALRFGGAEALDYVRRGAQRLTILHSLFSATKIVASTLEPDPATVGAATLIIQAVMDGRVAISESQIKQ
ncbi:MAG: ROK family transcriptional regulator [Anaerolineae bacterium]|nr:ROK family transcriptional regulator [Anaerolineae bacterium]